MIQSTAVTAGERSGAPESRAPGASGTNLLPTLEAGRTTSTPRPRRPPSGGADRRHRLTHRLVPIAAAAALAFIVGAVLGALHVAPERKVADRFARAWQRG